MPLNIGSSGEAANYLKFNAKSSRLAINDAEGDQIEITNLTAIFDLERIVTGWLRFREGQAPERLLDHPNGDSAPRPEGEGFKRGFVLQVYQAAEISLFTRPFSIEPRRYRASAPGVCRLLRPFSAGFAGLRQNPGVVRPSPSALAV